MKIEIDAMDIDANVTETNGPNHVPFHTTTNRHHKSRNNLRFEQKGRLKRLLHLLMRQHNWKQASGVLSVLLKGICRERFPMENRHKYHATLELLNYVLTDDLKTEKLKRVYELWARKDGPMYKWPMEDRHCANLELALFALLHDDIGLARDAITGLTQKNESRKDPVLSLMAGLTFYQLWYESLPKEFKLRKFDIVEIPTPSDISGMGSYNQVEHSNFPSAADFQDVEAPDRCASECSVGNYKDDDVKSDGDTLMEPSSQVHKSQVLYMDESREKTVTDEAPVYSHNSNLRNTSIFRSHGLDANLFPIRLLDVDDLGDEEFIEFYMGQFKEEYKIAEQHLRAALYETPPVLASLLPLIQLLLLGDRVGEALNELERVCRKTDAILPLRLKAILLECFDGKQSTMLSTCYEDILKKDPTCSHSLTGLITMHRVGDYDLESLTEMIALHLDATHATSSVWEEFASCFLKFSQCDEDHMSVHETVKGVDSSHHASLSATPKKFIQRKSRKLWKLRFRWWSTRHFSKNALISEMEVHDLQLSTFKAACASHLYGPEFDYVNIVHTHLEKEEDNASLLFLQLHMKNSLKIFENLK